MSAGSRIGFASTLATTGTSRRFDGYFRQRLRHYIGSRLHQRAMEGCRYRQEHRPLGAFRFGDLDRALDRRLAAGDKTNA